MIKVGIIGCGKISQVRHIPEYLDNPDVQIVGITDLSEERAKELAAPHGWKTYKTYQELLADKEIDAVSVCTANQTHAPITIEALKAGKHVLCEKPMAITLEECEAMVKEAEKQHKILMIGQNQRLAKAHVKARQLIRDGAIGDVISFHTTFGHGGPETWSITPGKNVWFFDKKKAAMGAMADLGIHKTDLIQFLLDQNITSVTAKLGTFDKRDANGNLIGVDDNALCIYQMESGINGVMHASWTFYGQEDNSTIIYGTKGIMHIYDSNDYSIRIVTKDEGDVIYNLDTIQTNDNQTKTGIIDMFIEGIKNNKQPEISGESVLPAMRAVFAAIKSSETGTTVLTNNGRRK
jgi:predicted dehydrogenase